MVGGLVNNPADRVRHDVVAWLLTVAALLVMFGLLQNSYWVPGGDSELYVSIARNLLLGNGYMFNGVAAWIAPPGWPLVLAAVMKLSPTFAVLKLVTMLSMTVALATYWWILRRFASPLRSSAVILLTAAISHVYALTFWLHSDACFSALTALSLLVAMQVREGRTAPWRIAALVLLGAAAVSVRWVGLLNVLLVCAVLTEVEQPWRTLRRCIPVVVMVCVAFFATQRLMERYAPAPLPAAVGAAFGVAPLPGDEAVAESGVSLSIGSEQTTLIRRLVGFGTWFSFFLFQPLRLGSGWPLLWWLATGVGWVVGVFAFATAADEFRARRWLLPAALLYVAALAIKWPQATARYLVPIAPLLILMILRGADSLSDPHAPRWTSRVATALLPIGIAATLLCNLALYATDVWVMRSPDFYDRYEAGTDKPLLAIAGYLDAQAAANWQTAVSLDYVNLGRRRISPTGLRILTMLTGKAMYSLPASFAATAAPLPDDPALRAWIEQRQVRFVVAQAPVSPWRAWHFQLGWLQRLRTGREPVPSDGWRLYRVDGEGPPLPVDIPAARSFPTRVPGL